MTVSENEGHFSLVDYRPNHQVILVAMIPRGLHIIEYMVESRIYYLLYSTKHTVLSPIKASALLFSDCSLRGASIGRGLQWKRLQLEVYGKYLIFQGFSGIPGGFAMAIRTNRALYQHQ
jgi:hypothetical protein